MTLRTPKWLPAMIAIVIVGPLVFRLLGFGAIEFLFVAIFTIYAVMQNEIDNLKFELESLRRIQSDTRDDHESRLDNLGRVLAHDRRLLGDL